MSAPRDLPSVDRLLREPASRELIDRFSRPRVVAAARELLAEHRLRLRQDGQSELLLIEALLDQLADLLGRSTQPSLRPVLNATGVVIHTNLGRAPLSASAIAAMQEVASSYSNLEYDLDPGRRGSRHEHLAELLSALTGAESSLIVNNNASALLLALSALAAEREVVISRGQLVEIGGGFRIPDVLRQSGAELVEVGTTNRTYADDYRQAIGPRTSLLMRVHSSNFRVIGFIHDADLSELADVAHQNGVLLLDDLGSGSLLDTARFGLAHEPMVQESIAAGADLVCFSGDKLLGGPQAGIILGRSELIRKLKAHPLTRALRPDKLCLAALRATLEHYVRGEARQKVPIWRMIACSSEAVEARSRELADRLSPRACFEILDGASAIGGGSLPGETLPTRLLAISAPGSSSALAARLRRASPPIIARIEHSQVVLDLRTILPEEDELLAASLAQALASS